MEVNLRSSGALFYGCVALIKHTLGGLKDRFICPRDNLLHLFDRKTHHLAAQMNEARVTSIA